MKRTIKKLSAIVMAIVVLVGIMPLAGLDGVFKFNRSTLQRSSAFPTDASRCAKHRVRAEE